MPDTEFDSLLHPDAALFDARTRRLEKLLQFVATPIALPIGKSRGSVVAVANPEVLQALDHALEAAFDAIRHSAMELVP